MNFKAIISGLIGATGLLSIYLIVVSLISGWPFTLLLDNKGNENSPVEWQGFRLAVITAAAF